MTDAMEYGKALFLITEEDGKSDKVLSDVQTAEQVLKSNPEYVKLLDSPALSGDERVGLADEAFKELDEMLSNLIKILTKKRLMHAFNDEPEYMDFISSPSIPLTQRLDSIKDIFSGSVEENVLSLTKIVAS